MLTLLAVLAPILVLALLIAVPVMAFRWIARRRKRAVPAGGDSTWTPTIGGPGPD
jgi:hypothetical protein